MTHSVQLRLFRFVPVALVLFAFILQLPTAQEDDPVEARLETLGVVVPDGPSPRPIEIDTAAPGGLPSSCQRPTHRLATNTPLTAPANSAF